MGSEQPVIEVNDLSFSYHEMEGKRSAILCHPDPERSEGEGSQEILRGACPERNEILRFAQNDRNEGLRLTVR
ncbi:hypothetical protein M1O51_00530 [Dehalococcoidia bacterium]|nr:hypothetical protein [Dehalococcoidia bacterium]